jgi:hypothetical protein
MFADSHLTGTTVIIRDPLVEMRKFNRLQKNHKGE